MTTYITLNPGEKLQDGDEYSTGSGWRAVPDFMIGDVIPVSTTEWRRTVDETKPSPKKTSLFSLFFKK